MNRRYVCMKSHGQRVILQIRLHLENENRFRSSHCWHGPFNNRIVLDFPSNMIMIIRVQ